MRPAHAGANRRELRRFRPQIMAIARVRGIDKVRDTTLETHANGRGHPGFVM